MTAAPSPASRAEFPLAAADLCVKCGLCLPHCPTYGLERQEGDSPRGRIALMQGLASGLIPVTPRLEAHLDGCLSCRACETACPAKVPFGLLLDEGRALLAAQDPTRARLTRRLGNLLRQRSAARLLLLLLWLYQASGLQRLLRAGWVPVGARLRRLESLLPRLRPLPFSARARPQGAGRVALFTGCVSDLADSGTLVAAERLFAACGLPLQVPAGQTCCGALYQHAGLKDEARACLRQNTQAFADADRIVGTASGCTAALLDAPQIAPGAEAAALKAKLHDIHALLLAHWPAQLHLRPLPARVALHLPCTQRHVVKQDGAIRALLQKIPGIELVDLDPRQACCGAAGTHFVTQPEAADALLAPKLAAAAALQPAIIVSSNIGCSLHLAGGLRRAGGPQPEVLHPLELLARQLG